ncbi:hypothetical protein [Candidatus Harpocratesius sp.]
MARIGANKFTTIVAISIAGLTYVTHFINVIKNRDDMSFSIGLAGLLLFIQYFLIIYVSNNPFVDYAVRFNILLSFLLGLNGFWHDKVLYNRAQRKKIQNVWISTLVS